MSDIIAKGKQVYSALQEGRYDDLVRLFSPDIRMERSAGLPRDLGGTYEGIDTVLGSSAIAVRDLFDMGPADVTLYDGGTVLIARGWYVGTAIPTGKSIRASFAHFWDYDGKQFTAVQQVTDSGVWHQVLS